METALYDVRGFALLRTQATEVAVPTRPVMEMVDVVGTVRSWSSQSVADTASIRCTSGSQADGQTEARAVRCAVPGAFLIHIRGGREDEGST